MTDIVTDIEAAFARVEAHIKTLLDGGAPHQQAHAQDLKTVLAAARSGGPVTVSPDLVAYDAKLEALNTAVHERAAELEEANSKLANLQGNIDNLMAVRDSLQSQLDAAKAEITDLKTQLQDQIANRKDPLSAAAEPVGGRVASESASKAE